MHDVLHHMQNERTIGIFQQSDNALHSQKLRPMRRAQKLEEKIDGAGRNRPIRRQAKGADPFVMSVRVVVMAMVMAVMIMPVMVMPVMVMVVAMFMSIMVIMIAAAALQPLSLGLAIAIGLFREPTPDIGGLACRIPEAGLDHVTRGGLVLCRVQDACGRVERP